MSRFNYDNTGKGVHPKLGSKSFMEGMARPGANQKGKSASTDIAKVSRPGGAEGTKGAGAKGSVPKAARPGTSNPRSAR